MSAEQFKSAGREKLVRYSRENSDVGPYLALYDAIMTCGRDTKGCATQAAKRQMAQYISQETGIPIADVEACLNDPQGCAKNQAIAFIAAELGVPVSAVYLAAECARQQDHDLCAKAGAVIVLTAVCTAYTGTVGAPACAIAAPMLVNAVWPYVSRITTALTFGYDINEVINFLTLGQGGRITGPISGFMKSIMGPSKGEFTKANAASVLWQAVRATQSEVNSAIVGVWDGMVATREALGLPLPQGDANAVEWTRKLWQMRLDDRKRLADDAVALERKYYQCLSGCSAMSCGCSAQHSAWKEKQTALNVFDLLSPPWPTPNPNEVTPLLAARETFINDFYVKLKENGFNNPAWRQSDHGKRVALTGGHWWHHSWGGMCTSCTENDVKVFADVTLKLFVAERIAKIEPVIFHFLEAFSVSMQADKANNPSAFLPMPPVALSPKFVTVPISKIMKPVLPADFGKKLLALSNKKKKLESESVFARGVVQSQIPIPSPPSAVDRMNDAWLWAKRNPDISVPLAAVSVVVLALLSKPLFRTIGFIPNARKCPACGEGELHPIGLTDYACTWCGERFGDTQPPLPMPTVLARILSPRNYGLHWQARNEREDDRTEKYGCYELGGSFIHKRGCRPGRPFCKWMTSKTLVHSRPSTMNEEDAVQKHGCYKFDRFVVHKRDCRPARPLCKWMRKMQPDKYGICGCDMYPWPHRAHSGRCRDKIMPWPAEIPEEWIEMAKETAKHDNDDDVVPF